MEIASRLALQNGRPQRAIGIIAKAVSAMDTAIKALENRPKNAAAHKIEWTGYAGARLINAKGSRIGELTAIDPAGDGRPPLARLRLGTRDVFGFLDLDGEELTISADRLIFGKKRFWGSVLIMVPTFSSDSTTIQESQTVALNKEP